MTQRRVKRCRPRAAMRAKKPSLGSVPRSANSAGWGTFPFWLNRLEEGLSRYPKLYGLVKHILVLLIEYMIRQRG